MYMVYVYSLSLMLYIIHAHEISFSERSEIRERKEGQE